MLIDKFNNELKANAGIMSRLANSIVREELLGKNLRLYKEDELVHKPPYSKYHSYYVVEGEMNRSLLYLPVIRVGAFKRIEFSHEFYSFIDNEWTVMTELSTFVDVLTNQFNLPITKELKNELINSRDNLASSYEALITKQRWVLQKNHSVFREKPSSWLQWVEWMKKNHQFDELSFSESMVVEGHPLHPSTKAKIGLTDEEVKRYAPEFEQDIPLLFVLVKRKYVTETMAKSWGGQSLFDLLPGLEEVSKEIQPSAEILENYVPFIVHPWQYEKILSEFFVQELLEHDIVPLPYTLLSKATLSFRTMNLLEFNFHVKLPVRVQATSATRTVSPQITVDGPRLSDLFDEIKESGELNNLIVLKEQYGAFFNSSADDKDMTKGRNLAYVMREDPRQYINEEDTAFVAASLTAENPYTGEPIFIELMKNHFGERDITSDMAAQYLKDYANCLISPLMLLIQNYGIALEGHMQNTIVCINNNRVKRVIIRDLGGIRVHQETVQSQFPTFHLESSSLMTEDMKEVIRKFHHAVIQNHIGDIIFVLCKYIPLDETILWRAIREVMEASLNKESSNFSLIHNELFAEKVETKSLLSMRIQQQAKEYIYTSFSNPLLKEKDKDANLSTYAN
ncbi:IucA/IucC family protein [Bacillus spongiae]|uniref:IucA/IucC family protein n=1 Tax=Bacillus spongiae TaxID=2683610 RepID=A0ABU8H9M0_9BACI